MLCMTNRKGFTLVELLVVVTIIVILLAMLAPSLKRAIYEAELAACAAQQDGIASMVILYAMDHKRRYPVRTAPEHVSADGVVVQLVIYSMNGIMSIRHGQGANDDRPPLRPYGSLKVFSCPLSDQVDFDDPASEGPNTLVFSSYDLWWDFGYSGGGKMQRLGSSVTWTDANGQNGAPGKKYKWNMLASDRDTYRGDILTAISSHADREGTLVLETDNGETFYLPDAVWVWASNWASSADITKDDHDKLTFDRNFAYDDGSVSMIRETRGEPDPRLASSPWEYDGHVYDYYPQNHQIMPEIGR